MKTDRKTTPELVKISAEEEKLARNLWSSMMKALLTMYKYRKELGEGINAHKRIEALDQLKCDFFEYTGLFPYLKDGKYEFDR